MSRLNRVLAEPVGEYLEVQDVDGRRRRVSLLAYEGDRPRAGDWVTVHSGFALTVVEPEEARAILSALAWSP